MSDAVAPSLTGLISEMISSRLLGVHTMLPAKVVSYDRATHTVEARIMVKPTVDKADGSQLLEEMPQPTNVPVAWPEGGSGPAGNSYYLEFPLVAGNEGMLVFSEAAWGHFRETGQLSPPGDLRRHSPAYCSFVPCRISKGGAYEEPGDVGLLIVPDERTFSVKRRGETDDFVVLFESLRDALVAAATVTPVPNDGGAAAFSAFKLAIQAWAADDIASPALKAGAP